MRATLDALSSRTRMTGAALAAVLWPGKDPEPRKSIAEGRLRAAAKAGYAHVAFEPVARQDWVIGDLSALKLRRPVYGISAAGLTAIDDFRWPSAVTDRINACARGGR